MAPQNAQWRQQRPARRSEVKKGGACNLQSFFIHSAPLVPVRVAEEGQAGAPSSCFSLRDLWASYDEWSAYGAEIPMRVYMDGAWQEIIQCYIPYLSGLQLFGADHTRRIPSPLSGYSSSDEEASCCSSSASILDAPSDSSSSSVCTSSTASTASVDSDSEADSKDSSGGSAADDRKAAFRLAARSGDGGSVLRKQHALGEPGNPLFEFFEEESPYARSPLADRITELAEEFPGLMSLSSSDLHPASWFAVAWYPAYRIPSLADATLSRDLQASLLTFHSVAVPPSLPAELHPHGAAHPIPPPPCAPAAAALAWRSETARQQLIASALSALSGAEAGAEGEGEAGQPAQQPPVSVACLRPFAFMPYKVAGRTWVDDYNLRSQHLPMISAAGMWLERRKVRLSDFEFFSRNFRPLPSGSFR